MVEPYTLLVVELGTGLATPADVESLHQLAEREYLLLCTGVPTKQCKEVDDSLGEIALLTVACRHLTTLRVVPLKREHGEAQPVAIPLRELALALGLEQQRQMCEAGHGVFPSESPVEQDMQRRAWQPLLATDDMGNLHEVVVNDIGKMVCWQLIGTLV